MEGQPLNLSYTIFNRKISSFVPIDAPPFHRPSLRHCVPFSCCKFTIFKCDSITKPESFLTFSQPKNASAGPFQYSFFLPTKMTDFPILSYTSITEIPTEPFQIPDALRRYSFGRSLALQAIIRSGVPPGKWAGRRTLWMDARRQLLSAAFQSQNIHPNKTNRRQTTLKDSIEGKSKYVFKLN